MVCSSDKVKTLELRLRHGGRRNKKKGEIAEFHDRLLLFRPTAKKSN
jgi:hypothetical protein